MSPVSIEVVVGVEVRVEVAVEVKVEVVLLPLSCCREAARVGHFNYLNAGEG